MAINSRTAAHDGRNETVASQARLFAVRVWTEEGVDGLECRGSAKDVVSGAHLGFRNWTDLTDFLHAHLDPNDGSTALDLNGGTKWQQ